MIRGKQIGALALALLLVASMGAAALGGTTALDAQTTQNDLDGVEEADEVYVMDDGDAVLVYEEDHDDPDAQAWAGSLGLETQSGLAHALYSADFSELDDEDAEDEPEMTGDMTMYMTPDEVGSSADLTFTDTEDLDEFDASVDMEQSPSDYYADVAFSMTVDEENHVDHEESVDVSATTETTATTISSTGSMTAEMGMEMEDATEESIDLTLTQDGDQYDLAVDETRDVPDFMHESWATEDAALQTLEQEYETVAMSLGGQVDVDLDAHDYDEADGTVDLEYTVTFTGITDELTELVAAELQQDPELQLDQTEAQAIADRLMSLEIEEVSVAAEMSGGDVTADWTVELHNYDEVVLGVVEIAESVDEVDDELADEFDDVRTMLEAQEAADLVQTEEVEFYFSEAPDETTVEFSASSEADNWAAYVDELEERGVEQFLTDTQLTFDAETVDDELEVSYDFESSEEAMLEQALDEMETAIEQDPMADDEMLEAIQQFRDAEFELARADMEITEEDAEFETAVAFEDMTQLEGVPFETDDGLTVTAIHAETDDGQTTMYVTVADFVSEDADEDEVREHQTVGADTEVHLPGDWDREFPSIDEDEVRSYLEQATAEDDSLLPGGVAGIALAGVAGVAILGGLFVAYRRFV